MIDFDKKELLLIEYQTCMEGYKYRDQLVQEEFSNLVQKFSIFLTLLLAINIFSTTSHFFYVLIVFVIGVVGCTSMIALLIDMQSCLSCKVVLRNRCAEIEADIGNESIFQYWKVLETRDKYFEERLYKGYHTKEKSINHGNVFINTCRIIIILWIVIFSAMIYYSGNRNKGIVSNKIIQSVPSPIKTVKKNDSMINHLDSTANYKGNIRKK